MSIALEVINELSLATILFVGGGKNLLTVAEVPLCERASAELLAVFLANFLAWLALGAALALRLLRAVGFVNHVGTIAAL